ncbi:hypothetical protein [Dyadobacter tibetensis]|uniref:hypothetical protein n=1 Tax=Dyadobacter tibetensis TaxID=1211851 RepID=UPI0018DB4205|nr:hypothetical protein [Dyadobacter tibetensis]
MRNITNFLVIFILAISLTSCELVGTIFKGGVWTGVIMVVAVLAFILWGVAKLFSGGR